MSTPIRVPGLGTATDEITLLEWIVSEGDNIKRGDIICEMETDKAVVQLESVAEGILLKQVVPVGTSVEEGTVIAYVGAAGEEVREEEVETPRERAAPVREGRVRAAPPLSPAKADSKVSPVVRNLARKMRVDLAQVKGTGPGGLITREDVRKAAKGGIP